MRHTTTIAGVLAALALAAPGVALAQTGTPPTAPDGPSLPQSVLDRFRPPVHQPQPETTPTPTPTPTPEVSPTPEPTPIAPAAAPRTTPPASDGCTIRGTEGNDRLRGTSRADVICGLGGNDVLLGLGGNDRIIGGPGRDRLDGGAGNDRLEARDGAADRLIGGGGRDRAETDRRGDSLRSVERVAGRLGARASSVQPIVFHSHLDCSRGLQVNSADLMVYTPDDVIIGVRDYVWHWTTSGWKFVTADSAAYTRKSGYANGFERIWFAPDAGITTSLGAFWNVMRGSGYYAVTQWIGVWDVATGRLVHVDYDWLRNSDANYYCRF
jgi:Ca2+-binding RTX toxin-like protein